MVRAVRVDDESQCEASILSQLHLLEQARALQLVAVCCCSVLQCVAG